MKSTFPSSIAGTSKSRHLAWLASSLGLAITLASTAFYFHGRLAVAQEKSNVRGYSVVQFNKIALEQPVAIVSAPGDTSRIFVVEKTGLIYVVTGWNTASPHRKVFLNLSRKVYTGGECGLLGLALPADYATSRRFFVYYSLNEGKLHQRLSRFAISAEDPDRADPSQEQPLWTQPDPAENHNGGDLHFGPDGYLYVSLGDGGGAGDQFNNARFIDKGFFASILRLDVDLHPTSLPPNPHPGIARDTNGAAFYAVPVDNPFVGATSYHGQSIDPKKVRTEIWASGLRNPWRFSFDPGTGRLFAGDVGQDAYEEVDLITKGRDYGWSYREGLHPFTSGPGGAHPPAGFKPTDPIFAYSHAVGSCIIGGVVYHGTSMPELSGAYIFADYVSGDVKALRKRSGKWTTSTLTNVPGIVGIGVDPRNGELLFANFTLGTIGQLKPQ